MQSPGLDTVIFRGSQSGSASFASATHEQIATLRDAARRIDDEWGADSPVDISIALDAFADALESYLPPEV